MLECGILSRGMAKWNLNERNYSRFSERILLKQYQRFSRLRDLRISPRLPVNILENAPNLDDLNIDPALLVDQLNHAIGVYRTDQPNSWGRTFWPVFWLARLIEWIAQVPVWFLSVIFGIQQEKVTRSLPGRLVASISNISLWIFALIQTLAALGQLGWWHSLVRWITHH